MAGIKGRKGIENTDDIDTMGTTTEATKGGGQITTMAGIHLDTITEGAVQILIPHVRGHRRQTEEAAIKEMDEVVDIVRPPEPRNVLEVVDDHLLLQEKDLVLILRVAIEDHQHGVDPGHQFLFEIRIIDIAGHRPFQRLDHENEALPLHPTSLEKRQVFSEIPTQVVPWTLVQTGLVQIHEMRI